MTFRICNYSLQPGFWLAGWLDLRPFFLMLTLGLPGVLAVIPGQRFDIRDLERDPKMDPGHFADLFENFAYKYHFYLQDPEVFLRTRSGDCDDYAILAGHVLTHHRFKTRFIRVELVGTDIRHTVCYVDDKKVYLDYNNRQFFFNLKKSGSSIREIAGKIADSFEKNWTTATEYTYTYDDPRKRPVYTVVKTDSPKQDPDYQR